MSIHLWWTFGSFPPFVCCQYCYKRGVQLSFWVPTFTLFKYISRNKIGRLYGNSILNILRNCYTIFHSNCTILHSHQQLTGTPVSPYPYQHSSFIVLLIFYCSHNFLVWSVSYHHLIWISLLMMLDILSYTCRPFVCLWRSICSNICPFKIRLFVFMLLVCNSSLFILNNVPYSYTLFLNIFFHLCVAFWFHWSFHLKHKFWWSLFVFSFDCLCFSCHIWETIA